MTSSSKTQSRKCCPFLLHLSNQYEGDWSNLLPQYFGELLDFFPQPHITLGICKIQYMFKRGRRPSFLLLCYLPLSHLVSQFKWTHGLLPFHFNHDELSLLDRDFIEINNRSTKSIFHLIPLYPILTETRGMHQIQNSISMPLQEVSQFSSDCFGGHFSLCD